MSLNSEPAPEPRMRNAAYTGVNGHEESGTRSKKAVRIC